MTRSRLYASHAPENRRRGTYWALTLPLTLAVLLALIGAAAIGWWARDPDRAWGAPTPSPTPTASPTKTPRPKPVCTMGPAPTILLTGSSTVNGWANYATDLAPLNAENIGVPGTGLGEQLVYLNRIIPTLKPEVIVLYSGANDTAAGTKSADVIANVNTFVAGAQERIPGVVIYYVSINDTPVGSKQRSVNADVNAAIAAESSATGALRYIDTDSALLTADGSVDASKFGTDGVHLNEAGYAIFGTLIRERLLTDGFANRPCL